MADEHASPPSEPDEQMEPTPVLEPEETKESLISRLNPMRLFQKNSVAFQLRDAQSLMEKKLFAQATNAFQKTLEMDPENVEAFKGLGQVLMRKGGRTNIESSLKQFHEATLRDPLNEEIYVLNSQVMQALGRTKESNLEQKKALSLRTLRKDPKNAIAANNIGIAMVRLGKIAMAISYFQKSIDSDRSYDMPRRNLASTYLQLAEKETNPQKQKDLLGKASVEISKALEIGVSPPTLVVQTRILIMTGDTEQALEVINKANDLQPGSKLIMTVKQGVLEKLNRLTEARETYEGAKSFAPT